MSTVNESNFIVHRTTGEIYKLILSVTLSSHYEKIDMETDKITDLVLQPSNIKPTITNSFIQCKYLEKAQYLHYEICLNSVFNDHYILQH